MKMVTVKTADLIGPALDLAVATAVGFQAFELGGKCYQGCGDNWSRAALAPWSPSSDWSHCGPLIEKYATKIEHWPTETTPNKSNARIAIAGSAYWESGPSPLAAVCRAIVRAKLGDEVQVPAELVQP